MPWRFESPVRWLVLSL